jgi:short-subunit dehydrogenase
MRDGSARSLPVSQIAAVDALPEQVLERFGAIHGVINYAGIIQPFRRLNDLDFPTIERVMDVNLKGILFVTKAFLRHLLQRPEAHIANVSSMGGFVPVPGQNVYGAAMAAVKLMTEGLAAELSHTNVWVSVVFPGAVATDIAANSGVGTALQMEGRGGGIPLTAARAAEIIVRGIERNKVRIFVGKDSAFLDKLYRLSPSVASRAVGKAMQAAAQGVTGPRKWYRLRWGSS